MFRIRRIFDDLTPANKYALEQVQGILRDQFERLEQKKIDRIPEALRKPFKYGFDTTVFVAEDHMGKVCGLACLDRDETLNFCYLDYLASSKGATGGGVGGALYERVRSEAFALGAIGMFFECLPDDPALCHDATILKQNKARLRFYEPYGARPIAHTAYETPIKEGDDNPPYLVMDRLGRAAPLAAATLRKIVRRVLEQKYSDVCSSDYVRMVEQSITEDPVQQRPVRYTHKNENDIDFQKTPQSVLKIAVVKTDMHEIHHVRERGYVESPVRIRAISKVIENDKNIEFVSPRNYPDQWIMAVHDAKFVNYLKNVCKEADPQKPVYPYVFPVRNRARPPKDLPIRAGYYCIDTFTPISGHAYKAARRAVDCAMTAAHELLSGRRMAYALVRPPGHHAERAFFGGFCYFNNAAIASHFLSHYGKVAILDIDYHHGNGQQDIFYQRSDVFTQSIHGHPSFAYPYFTGFADEKGEGEGLGFNVNYPLPEKLKEGQYKEALFHALTRIRSFRPTYLVVCFGVDTAKADPTGTWGHGKKDFFAIGAAIGALQLPTLIVQEGGYNNRSIGGNVRAFLGGVAQAQTGLKSQPKPAIRLKSSLK